MSKLRTSFGLLGAAALVVSVSACQKYDAKGGGTAAMADSSAVTDAIKADEKAWNEHFHTKNLDGLLSHYAPDANAVFPGSAAVSGDALKAAFGEAVKDPNFDVSFSADKIDTSGDLAYARGHFTEKYTDPATKRAKSDGGTYITVYKKQADGSWKVVEDMPVVEPAAPAATPAAG